MNAMIEYDLEQDWARAAEVADSGWSALCSASKLSDSLVVGMASLCIIADRLIELSVTKDKNDRGELRAAFQALLQRAFDMRDALL